MQHPRVTAVVVAHNGSAFLSATLAALGAQEHPADFVIGVDAGSTDDSASILQLELPVGSPVVGAPSRAGFGAAVRVGLAELPERRPPVEGSESAHEWLWLLHDDSAPEPQALEELLLAVERAPSVTVAGSKQVEWGNRRKLVDVGLSISRWAERLTLIDVDELDQGQYDSRSDVFAVNSAGMLIRRDVWELLEGFDPALPGTGDDVDFCWRNRLAGHRVVVVPSAVIRHASSRTHPTVAHRAARKAEVYLRLKHSTLWKVPFLAVGAVIGGFGRLVLGLLAKDPGYGFSQLFASVSAVLRPVDLFRSRRRATRTRKLPRNTVRALRTSRREVWSHRRSVIDAFSAEGHLSEAAIADEQSAYIPSGDAAEDFSSLAAPSRTWVGVGAMVATVVLAAVSLVGLYRLIGAPALAGGALLPVSASMVDIWNNASSWWIPLAFGMAGHGDPFGYVLWLLAALGFGNGNVVLVTLVLLALPMAGLSAWFAAGALTWSRGLRVWAAFFWAAVPALQVAVGSGRLGALLVHLLLPLAGLALIRAVGGARAPQPGSHLHAPGVAPAASSPYAIAFDDDDAYARRRPVEVMLKPGISGVPSWTAAATAGLLLAAITAAAPSLLPLTVVGVLTAAVLLRRRAKTLWWSLLPALALFVPFIASTTDQLRAVLADPGVPVPFEAAALWQQLLGYPVAFDPTAALAALPFLPEGPWALAAALLVGGPTLLLAAAALFLPGRGTAVARGLWVLGLAALLLSTALSFVAVSVGSSALITPFTGPLVSVLMLSMAGAALVGADKALSAHQTGIARKARADASAPRRRTGPALVAAAVVLGIGPAVSLGLWAIPTPVETTAVALSGDTASTDSLATDSLTNDNLEPSANAGTRFGADLLLAPSAERTLPATAADRGNSAERTKSLVLNVDGSNNVSAALMRSGGTTLDQLSQIYSARGLYGPLGSAEVRADDEATAAIRSTVAVIVAGTGYDPRQELSQLGVGFIVLQQSDTAAEVLAGQIDAVPGLVAVGNTNSGWLWRVVPGTGSDDAVTTADTTSLENTAGARVRIIDAEGTTVEVVDSGPTSVSTIIPAGDDQRSLVLAERSDAGWRATLDGVALTPRTTEWSQEFELPADGGRLEVTYVTAWEPWAGIGTAVIIGLTVLLAIPMPSRPRFVRTYPGRRGTPATVVPQPAGADATAPADQPADSSAEPARSAVAASSTGSAGERPANDTSILTARGRS
ncbi:glycosyltransferase family 2 protein [Arthrobacter sp. AET 35A]|nr:MULTISPECIES: glycosyltransferase family 2 protein [unclassified Arthrobacter]MBE0009026.1 glycosyltransferase family 2 protein [Arthrobacter sp. AET 35A]NOJ62844.1 glycosyltransferase family 2 protein [Arthrobacter sp. 147(2020)]